MRSPVQLTLPPSRLLLILLALAASGAVAVGAHAWARRATANSPAARVETVAISSADRPAESHDGEAEAEIITVRPTGFEPAEITRPRGEFNLTVQNLTGLDELSLRLDREDGGERLHEVRTLRGRRNWRKNINLPPGAYLLTEADHPGWVCRVIITGR